MQVEHEVIHLPSPTIWPMVLALGLALMCTGLVTNLYIGLLGLVLFVSAAGGWFLQVFPFESHVNVPVEVETIQILSSRTLMDRLPVGDMHRKILPVESWHVTTGLKGGLAGGLAMIVPATLFSLIRYHSMWYAANLLAAGGFVRWAGASDTFLSQFHWQGLLAAVVIHGLTSLLVGLLYGAMLPMYPKYPILTAGVVIPILFTLTLRPALGLISPILSERIDWFWFTASQVTFGLVCGFVVNLQAKVRTPQFQALPFSVRAGIHGDSGEGYDSKEKAAPMNPSFLKRSIMGGMLCLGLAGCRNAPGKPRLDSATLRPEQVVDFPTLYKQNCSACHGAQGRQGAAISLANPVYLATAGPENLSHTTTNGLPGTLMPAFAKTRGGLLTDTQIDVLTKGMIQSWGPSTALVTLPYASHTQGDPERGKIAYTAFCASCHGAEGTGAAHVGSIVDPAYLDLISDQALRSIILAGKPGQGMPDWRSDNSQRPMTDQEVTDIVAWVTTYRPDLQRQDLRRTPHE